MRFPRRVLLQGSAAGLVALRCGRTALFEDDEPNGSEDMTMPAEGSVRPLVRRAEVLLQSNAGGSPQALALTNPTGEPWEIHEIKFGIRRETDLTSREASAGALIGCRMTWLGKPVTQGFVPVWNFGLAKRAGLEIQTPVRYSPLPSSIYARTSDAYYGWELDHPLYIPPGTTLLPEFKHSGLSPRTYRASILYSGNVLVNAPRPRKVKVPFVSAWQSNFYEALTETGEETSPETVLYNDLGAPWTIERFIGRVALNTSLLADPGGGNATIETIVDDLADGLFAGEMFRVKHYDSLGNIVVRGYAAGNGPPLRSVYGPRGRAWQQRHTLDAEQRHTIVLFKKAAPEGTQYAVVSGGFDSQTIQAVHGAAQISAVGWREELVP